VHPHRLNKFHPFARQWMTENAWPSVFQEPSRGRTNISSSLLLESSFPVASHSFPITGSISPRSLKNLIGPPFLHSPILSFPSLPPGRTPLPDHWLSECTSSPRAPLSYAVFSKSQMRVWKYHHFCSMAHNPHREGRSMLPVEC
jgi:hypothetical protein